MSDYTPFPVWPRPAEGGGVSSHPALTGRNNASQHNGDAVDVAVAELFAGTLNEFAQQVLTGGLGGGSVVVVVAAVGDGGDDIDLDGAGPDDVGLVLVWGRTDNRNGVYDVSIADGWVLVDPQPTTVIAWALVDGSTFDPVLDSGVWSLFTRTSLGDWVALGAVPNLGGNSGQVWGTTGWFNLTIPDSADDIGAAPATRTVGTGLGTSGTVDLDMSAVHGTIQTIAATGAMTFTTSNRAAGREVTLIISAGGSSRTLSWPSWVAVGAALPTTLASGKTLVATVTFVDTTDAAAVATAAVQP